MTAPGLRACLAIAAIALACSTLAARAEEPATTTPGSIALHDGFTASPRFFDRGLELQKRKAGAGLGWNGVAALRFGATRFTGEAPWIDGVLRTGDGRTFGVTVTDEESPTVVLRFDSFSFRWNPGRLRR